MSQPNKPSEKGFKPGANMPHGDYDPQKEGMSDSGNHAVGHPGNDEPYGYEAEGTAGAAGNLQQGRQPARSEQGLRQDNQNFTGHHNQQNGQQSAQQSAADAATDATHRDRNAGARGDDNTHTNRDKK
jgi:hypothetical protein